MFSRATTLAGPPLDDGPLTGSSPLDTLCDQKQVDRELEAWKAEKDTRREERYVKYVLNELGVLGSTAAMRKSSGGKLTLAWMCEELGGWPMWLTATWVPFVYRTFFTQLFNAYTTTPVYARFLEAKASAPHDWGGSHGVIFTAPNVKTARGALVMHDAVTTLQQNETIIVHRVRDEDVVIERLSNLVARYAGHVALRP